MTKKRSTKTHALGEMLVDISRSLRDPTAPGTGVTTDMPGIDAEVMSNFDRKVDQAAADYLQTHPGTHAGYAGWDFNGRVWFDGSVWKCEVWQHRSPVAILEAGSPKELMDAVSEEYGYD